MTDWNKAKVVDLRAELKKRGLPQTGLKPALVARLTEAENGDGSESEATIQDDALKLDASSATSPETISPTTQPASNLGEELPANIPSQSAPLTELTSQDVVADSDTVDPQVAESQKSVSQAVAHGSTLPLVEPQELVEDRQKRKRRSQSPPISSLDASRKRLRQDDDAGIKEELDIVKAKEDSVLLEKHNAVGLAAINVASEQVAEPESGPTIVDATKEEVAIEDVVMTDKLISPDIESSSKMETATSEMFEQSPPRTRDSRFKGLFSTPQAPATEESKSGDSHEGPIEQYRIVSPAIHPATSALYIRDFMRPLSTSSLQTYLATLATPPGRDVDSDVILKFYLDPIRTHAFVSFTNTSAASRVRSALHGCIWPEERTRKPLWVDFIPLEKVQDWIDKEESTKAGARSPAKKWEVVYETDDDRRVTAYLQEFGNTLTRQQPVQQSPIALTPAAPVVPLRVIEGAPSGPRATQSSHPKPVTNTKTLDELFNSTKTKPLLYWKSVDKDLANKRLDRIEDLTSKHYARGTGGEINRYIFEDGDELVDRGPEIFPGIRPPGGHRGGSRGGGGYRGGGGRGGYQTRGGFGGPVYDSYKGGRGGGSDRRDDRDDRRY